LEWLPSVSLTNKKFAQMNNSNYRMFIGSKRVLKDA